MIIIFSIIFFVIKVTSNYIYQLFFWNDFIIKIFIILGLLLVSYLLYFCPRFKRRKLSYIRNKRLEFPFKYKVKSYLQLIVASMISLLYLNIFFILFLYLRFQHTNDRLNIFLLLSNVKHLVNVTSNTNLFLIIIILILGLFVYILILYKIKNWFKFYRIQLYFYCHKNETLMLKFYDNIEKYTLTNVINSFCNKISLLISDKNLKKNGKFIKVSLWEELFFGFLRAGKFRFHYYTLLFVFIFDIIMYGGILTHINIILPYIFLYDIWVRFTKAFYTKNLMYDDFVYHYIYLNIIFNSDYEVIFENNRSWSKEFIAEVFNNYIFNDFLDKEMVIHLKNNNKFNLSKILEAYKSKNGLQKVKIYNISQIDIIMFLFCCIWLFCYF